MVIVIEDSVIALAAVNTEKAISFRKTDGDTYNSYNTKGAASVTAGSLYAAAIDKGVHVHQFGKQQDRVRVIARKQSVFSDKFSDGYIRGSGSWQVAGFIKKNGQWHKAKVIRIPTEYDLFAKGRGIFETSILKDKRVLVIGVGSGGNTVATGMAQLGIDSIDIVDHDRLDIGNVVRFQTGGISALGRLKVNLVKDIILNINPYATVTAHNIKVTEHNQDKLRDIISKSDVVINCADDPGAKIIINRICVELNAPLIMGGCYRRAHAGAALYIRPGETPCYQCFLSNIKNAETDREISNQRQADAVSYSDRIVPVEPGLANDIAPISQFIVKLALTELLKDKDTTLSSLNDDFRAFWYLWLNRREPDTPYENLPPMGFSFSGTSIMRWYGLPMSKNAACPVCGDLTLDPDDGTKITVTKEDEEFFR